MARKGEQILREVATAPIMGWQRTTTFTKGRKNPKLVTDTSSFTIRAWEVGALAFAGLFAYGLWKFAEKLRKDEVDWTEVTLSGGPIGAILFGTG